MTVFVNGLLVQKQGDPVIPEDFHAVGFLTVVALGRPVALVSQLTTGHGGFPPTPAITGSSTVFAGGLPVVRAGDQYAPHTDGEETHPGTAAPIP